MEVEISVEGEVWLITFLMQYRYVILLFIPIVPKKSRYFVLLSDFSLVCFYMRYLFSTKVTSFATLTKQTGPQMSIHIPWIQRKSC